MNEITIILLGSEPDFKAQIAHWSNARSFDPPKQTASGYWIVRIPVERLAEAENGLADLTALHTASISSDAGAKCPARLIFGLELYRLRESKGKVRLSGTPAGVIATFSRT